MERLVFNAGHDGIFNMLCAGGGKATDFNHLMFEDYEIWHQLQEPVARKQCVIAADPRHDEDFMAMYDLASLLFDEKALQLTFVLPQMKLKRADKYVLTRALSSIPRAPLGNRLAIVDPSSKVTPRYLDAWLHAEPHQSKHLGDQPALDLFVTTEKPVLFCTAKYQYLADEMLALSDGAFDAGEVARKFVGNRFLDDAKLAEIAVHDPLQTWTARKPRNEAEQQLMASRFRKRKLSDEQKAQLAEKMDLRNPTDVTHPLSARYRFKKLLTNVAGRNVIIVGGTINDAETVELYRMANAAYDAGALSITMVVPYFGYSTQERKVKPMESVKAKHRCRFLSSVPRCPMGNEIVLIDLHSEAMPGCFENGLSVVHLYAGKRLVKSLSDKGGDWLLLSADSGRSKWVESMARDCGNRGWAWADKSRKDGETETRRFSGDVAGKSGKMFDDIGRTLGSAGNAAKLYVEGGCTPLDLVLTHMVSPGDSLDNLRARGLFENVYVTNTHPRAVQLQKQYPGYVHVYSVASLLVDQLLGRNGANSQTLS